MSLLFDFSLGRASIFSGFSVRLSRALGQTWPPYFLFSHTILISRDHRQFDTVKYNGIRLSRPQVQRNVHIRIRCGCRVRPGNLLETVPLARGDASGAGADSLVWNNKRVPYADKHTAKRIRRAGLIALIDAEIHAVRIRSVRAEIVNRLCNNNHRVTVFVRRHAFDGSVRTPYGISGLAAARVDKEGR